MLKCCLPFEKNKHEVRGLPNSLFCIEELNTMKLESQLKTHVTLNLREKCKILINSPHMYMIQSYNSWEPPLNILKL